MLYMFKKSSEFSRVQDNTVLQWTSCQKSINLYFLVLWNFTKIPSALYAILFIVWEPLWKYNYKYTLTDWAILFYQLGIILFITYNLIYNILYYKLLNYYQEQTKYAYHTIVYSWPYPHPYGF